MAKYERHIFVCCNQREPGSARGCCDPAGEAKLQKAFKEALKVRELKGRVRANKAGCLDQCEHGPNVVVYPEQVWYGGVRVEDVAEIVEQHIVGGKPVERLRIADECINNRECPHRARGRKQEAGGRSS